jgi:hypothetical protein
MIKKVIFHVGEAHPLYNKVVDAEIISESAGYDRKRIYARTVEPVEFPENPEGLLVFKNGKLIGFETSPAHSSVHEGYCVLAA